MPYEVKIEGLTPYIKYRNASQKAKQLIKMYQEQQIQDQLLNNIKYILQNKTVKISIEIE